MTEATRPVTTRSATQDDMAAVATMAGKFHAWLAALDGSDPCFDAEATAAKLVRCGFGQRPLFSALIAEAKGEAGGEAVGYALYNIGFWADSLQGMVLLSDLYVRGAWRSRGVGKALMDRLAEIGRGGCEIVLWTVWTKNEAARRFYERLGAQAIDDERLMTWPI
jgi:GNAT superfamily N-acetyltransferase